MCYQAVSKRSFRTEMWNFNFWWSGIKKCGKQNENCTYSSTLVVISNHRQHDYRTLEELTGCEITMDITWGGEGCFREERCPHDAHFPQTNDPRCKPFPTLGRVEPHCWIWVYFWKKKNATPASLTRCFLSQNLLEVIPKADSRAVTGNGYVNHEVQCVV